MSSSENFEAFLERLQLDSKQVDRMNSAEASLSKKLREHFGLAPHQVFLQGSYANGTAIKPPPSSSDGEYDVDLVVDSAGAADHPRDALKATHEALEAVGYGSQIEDDGDRERPCVRLRYAPDDAGHFHVDVVPVRKASGQAPYEVPRPAESKWKETAPQEYAQWCTGQGEPFLRTVQELKRWRDETQTARQAIKSIVLQVLIFEQMPASGSDGERIAKTLRGINDRLAASPDHPVEVRNPVLRSENLTASWPIAAYRNFCRCCGEAAELAEEALAEADEQESRRRWRQLLGSDFPKQDGGGGDKGGSPPRPKPGKDKPPQKAPRSEWA